MPQTQFRGKIIIEKLLINYSNLINSFPFESNLTLHYSHIKTFNNRSSERKSWAYLILIHFNEPSCNAPNPI